MREMRRLARLAAVGICMLAALSGLLWLEHRRPLSLPEPTGPFAVGRTSYEWTEPTGRNEPAGEVGAKRDLVVWMWYPAKRGTALRRAAYVPQAWSAALRKYSGPVISALTRDSAKVQTHSFEDAEVSAETQTFPVVLMRAGLGALTTDYTTLAEDLASHGYVVVGFDAPGRTVVVVFSDGRVMIRKPENNPETLSDGAAKQLAQRLLVMWISDLQFVTDQLERLNQGGAGGRFAARLDMTRIGIFGHSFGGAQAAEFCREDARCKAGVDIDGRPFGKVVQEGLQRPFLFLMSDHRGEEANPESREILAELRGIYSQLPAEDREWLTILGTNHFSFSDQILLKSQVILGTARLFGVGGKTGGKRGLRITAECVRNFFDEHLKGWPSRLGQLTAEYPEILADNQQP